MTLASTRRTFLKSAAGALAASPLLITHPLRGKESPLNRLNVGFVGTGNQGMGLLTRVVQKLPEARVVAVCDVNRGSTGYKEPDHFYGREPAQKLVNQTYGNNDCKAYADFRELLGDKEIDAVFLVVPDHWHAVLTVLAARAGKAIYCEKPLSLTVSEGREMIRAVRENNIILQVGSHERSNPVSRFVCEAVKAGAVGQLTRIDTVVGYNNKTGPGTGWKPEPIPAGFDYETWLGPAPQVPYHHDRCLYRFRFNYDYSGGQITNFGAHCNDMAHWGMGLDRGSPVEIECLKAKFPEPGSLFNTALETHFRARYANGVELVCASGPESVQVRFEGSDGWILTGYKGTLASRPELLKGLPEKTLNGLDPHTLHMQNFFAAVQAGREPVAPIEVGHASAVLCHMANAAIRLYGEQGQSEVLSWNAETEQFTNSERANALLEHEHRSPWGEVLTRNS